MNGYISIREASYKWGVSERRVNQYCSLGRIPGQNDSGVPGQFLLMQKSQVILANPKVKNRKGA